MLIRNCILFLESHFCVVVSFKNDGVRRELGEAGFELFVRLHAERAPVSMEEKYDFLSRFVCGRCLRAGIGLIRSCC